MEHKCLDVVMVFIHILYFCKVLTMENSTYSYTESTLSWRALEFRGAENAARLFFISLVCGRRQGLPGGAGNDFPPVGSEGSRTMALALPFGET